MNKEMILSVLKRFGRVFLAAFIASVVGQLSQSQVHSLEDLKKLGFSVVVAGIAAGLTAIDKAFRYESPSSEEGVS